MNFAFVTALVVLSRPIDAWYVDLPLRTTRSLATTELPRALASIVESSDFIEAIEPMICEIPPLHNVQVSLELSDDSCQLRVGKDATKSDFGWICKKFYEMRDQFEDTVETEPLRDVVTRHFNNVFPDTGCQPTESMDLTNVLDQETLQTFAGQGFVTVDLPYKTSTTTHSLLDEYLIKNTGQSPDVRTDKVHFLSESEANEVGMTEQYELLMSIAAYLNQNYRLEESPHSPLAPASVEEPFTVPRRLQLAEYGQGDFYKAHSDNSLTDEFTRDGKHQIRRNFREITCILYCNDDWKEEDGGALRIHPDSQDYFNIDDAVDECKSVDILPKNGRLLIFDSRLIHSVEPVLSNDKLRRALTIWINRPIDIDVPGESYYG